MDSPAARLARQAAAAEWEERRAAGALPDPEEAADALPSAPQAAAAAMDGATVHGMPAHTDIEALLLAKKKKVWLAGLGPSSC